MFYNFDDIIWTPAAPRAAKEPCVRLRSTELYQLLEFQGLINLEVQVGFDAFSIPIQQGIFPWRHDFDAREVDQLWISQVIRNECPTLRQIRILDGGRMPAMTEAELATWKSNLAQLGAILQLRIELQSRLPKQAVTVPDSPEPTPVRVCNHDIKPRHSLRADSLYDTGLPLYAPESQGEVLYAHGTRRCDAAERSEEVGQFWVDCMEMGKADLSLHSSRHSLKTLLWQTGVLRVG